MSRRIFSRSGLVLLGLLLSVAFAAAPASAGTQVVSGEDEHCNPDPGSDAVAPICDFTRKVIQYARAGAPDPAKPILLIDCDGPNSAGANWVTGAYEGTAPDVVLVRPPTCPDSGARAVTDADYASTVFSTDNFSAIVVGHEVGRNGQLNPRKADFKAFFDQGGGIATFDSGDNVDSNLDFLPVDVTLLDGALIRDYRVTPDGASDLQITDTEISDGGSRHEVYGEPGSGSPLKVGARDNYGSQAGAAQVAENRPMVLYTRVDRRPPVSSSGGCVNGNEVGIKVTDEVGGSGPASVRFTVDGGAEQSVNVDAEGNARVGVPRGEHTVTFRGVDKAGNVEANANSVTVVCSPVVQQAQPDTARPTAAVAGVRSSCVRRAFQVRITVDDNVGIARVTAKRDGRHLVNRAFSATTRSSFTVRVGVAGLKAGRHTIAIAVRDTAGNRRTVNRTFRVCAAQRRPAPAPRFTG